MRCKKNNSLGLLKNFMNEDIDIKQNTEFKNLSENSEQNPNNHENNDWIKILKYNKDLTGKFEITNKSIGKGTFGVVYFGINLEKHIPIAIKCMRAEKANLNNFSKEINILNTLKEEKLFPRIFYSEFDNRNKIIIQSLLGPNLNDLLNLCGDKIPLFTSINIFIELIDRIKTIHKHGIIHRDIKPSNIVFGNFSSRNPNEKYGIYLIDYGLSVKYIDDKNKHYQYSNNNKFVGTLDYASIHAHDGEKQSRRDDLESLFYSVIYLFRGKLPWKIIRQISIDKQEDKVNVGNMKKNFTNSDSFKNLPKIFKFIYKNIKILDFDEEPPYDYLIIVLEKEKEIIFDTEKNKPRFKYFWLNIINDAFFSKYEKTGKIQNIKNIFHNIKKENLKDFFKDITNI